MTFIKQCYIAIVAQIKLESFLKNQKMQYKNKQTNNPIRAPARITNKSPGAYSGSDS